MRKTVKNKRQSGLLYVEMLIVIAMSIIITAIAIPQYVGTAAYLRAAGDLRSLNARNGAGQDGRAAATLRNARAYVTWRQHLSPGNLEQDGMRAGCWQTDATR